MSELDDVKRIGPPVPSVVVVECPICRGDGWVETSIDDLGVGRGHRCATCAGRGRIATEGGEP